MKVNFIVMKTYGRKNGNTKTFSENVKIIISGLILVISSLHSIYGRTFALDH